MSPKQQIYHDFFFWTLPHLRNVTTQPWWRRLRDRSTYYESELIHNLPQSMYESEYTNHDIWFLNVQAKSYYEQCSEKISPLYLKQIERIKELFDLVPSNMKADLQWTGPKEKSNEK